MNRQESAPATPSQPFRSLPCRRLAEGVFSDDDAGVIIEKELSIFVNGQHLATASIAPAQEREFVTGYLYSQGLINSYGEIASLDIEGGNAHVAADIKPPVPASGGGYRIISGGGRAPFTDENGLPEIASEIKIAQRDVFRAMNALFDRAEIYRATEGAHAAGLFTPAAEPLCIAEDIGRHNTLDKVIGYGLSHGIDFGRSFLVTTGRLASEMVSKAGRAGIPVIATKTAVTGRGLEIGRGCRMTVVGFVRDRGNRINTDMEVRIIMEPGMKIYSHPERIALD